MFYNHCRKGSEIHLAMCKPLIRFGGGSKSIEFMRLMRSYSSMFAFSSFGVKADVSISACRGPYVFRARHNINP